MYDIRKSKILIIEDSKESIDILVNALKDQYILITEENGRRAVGVAVNDRPDLIIMGIIMKGMEDFEVFRDLKNNPVTREIPAILITPIDNHGYKTRSFEIGAVDYITQPFDIPEVKARVQHHLMLKSAQMALENQSLILEEKIKERTEELTDAIELVEQAQKMEAIGTLASGISHDFNNILTPIMIQTELALMKIPEESDLEPHLKKIYKASERAKDLVKQILSFCRPGEIEQDTFQMSPIIKEALKLLRASLPSTIEIRTDIQGNSSTIKGNPTQIHLILMNLCANSGHAMQKNGGVLSVGLSKVTQISKEMERMKALVPGDYVKLSVTDTGCGMNRKTLKRIFEPYYTTKKKSEGTGLGLAIVNRIVTDYGGMINVESAPGKGSTISIFFPLIKDTTPAEPEKQELPYRGTDRILFVDDEEATVDALRDSLEHLGYHVVGETSSVEALRVFKAKPTSFDIVITDQTMPKMTGIELAAELLEIQPDIPIILCTGYSDKLKQKRIHKMGITTLISKPFDINIITEAIYQALK